MGAGGFPAATATARDLPDGVVYQSEPLDDDMTIAGPILFQMYASLLGTDTDFFVSLHDVDDKGNVSYLQRGVLKASHRDVDPLRSFYADDNGSKVMVQPYRPHTSPRLVPPGEVIKYDLEIWPVGHIFRKGHSLRIQIHTPPAIDGIWGYTATHHQPAVVNVHHSSQYPTNLMLPVVTDVKPGTAAPNTDCRVPGGFACVPGSGF